MKTILLIFTIFIFQLSSKAEVVFSSMVIDGDSLYVSLKNSEGVPAPVLAIIRTSDFKVQQIKVPKSFKLREIRNIFLHNKTLVAFTQKTIEQGDDPQISLYNIKSKSWEMIGAISCPFFKEMFLTGNTLSLTCDEDNSKGKEVEVVKTISLSKSKSIMNKNQLKKVIPFLKEELKNKNISVKLQGFTYEWDKLIISNLKNKSKKTFLAKEIYNTNKK